ncbi:MAG: S8 family peptidase [Clostridia bacterium]|nr:S8 family peptidase [Clostridia bacterium]
MRFWTGGRGPRAFRRKIVRFRPGVPPDEDWVCRLGGQPVRRLWLLNAIVADFPDAFDARPLAVADAAGVEDVDDDLSISALGRFRWVGFGAPWSRGTGSEPVIPWGVASIGAPEVWTVTRGEGVRVAVLDTGADLGHPDLSANLAGGYNAIEPGRPPLDDNGHGTHVCGIIAAAGTGKGSVVGVAPAARLYTVKVMDRYGRGHLSDLIEGLAWCVDNGMQVVNLSLGSPESNASFELAIRNAARAGLLLVAAAGTAGPGPDSVMYPARYADVLAVAAVDRCDRLAPFSSRGPQIDLAAPGVDVLSTWPGTYAEQRGTSAAAPHVAGVAALVLALHPQLAPRRLAQVLRTTARFVPGLSPGQQGAGVVDARRAVRGTSAVGGA